MHHQREEKWFKKKREKLANPQFAINGQFLGTSGTSMSMDQAGRDGKILKKGKASEEIPGYLEENKSY